MLACYILYSRTRNRYYVGATQEKILGSIGGSPIKLLRSQSLHHGVLDWIEFLQISCSCLQQARKIESHIKRMKSRKYIENLKRYPEMIEKLISQYA